MLVLLEHGAGSPHVRRGAIQGPEASPRQDPPVLAPGLATATGWITTAKKGCKSLGIGAMRTRIYQTPRIRQTHAVSAALHCRALRAPPQHLD